jgi:ATP-binding cassette subfamily B protein
VSVGRMPGFLSSFRTRARGAAAGAAVAVRPPPVIEEQEERYRPIDWKLVRRLLRELRPYRWQYVVGISLGLIHVMLDLIGPAFIGRISNYTTDFVRGLVPVTQDQAIRHVVSLVGIWALLFVGSIVFQRFCILVMTRAGESVQFDLRRKLFDHLQELSMSYYDKTKLGRIISRMTSDIGAMREVNVWGIWQVVYSTSVMLFAAIALAVSSHPLLLLSVAWLAPVLFLANRLFQKRAAGMHQAAREGWTRVSTNLAENITGMRVVTAFHRQDPNLFVFNRLQDDNTANNVRVARINGVYQPTLQVIGYVGRFIILVYGGYLVATGRVTIGGIIQSYLYWDYFMNPVQVLGNFHNQMLMAMAGAERVFNLLDTRPDVSDAPDAKPLKRIIGRVQSEDVTFGYNPDRPVLHDVNFEARPGEMFALVGATGSGKTSIVSLIARFYQPQKGRVLVDGNDLRYVTGESLHKQMGLVLQVNYLFSGTVLENIRYAKPGATEEDVVRASREIGSFDAIMTLKDGFHTSVGERGANMSLGQRQLICFTRAYLADPRIFMLDEATSAVDTATELLVQRSLEKLLEGRTTFVVAHRLSTIMRADCILVIDKGHIIERGTHKELLAAGGKYAHLYRQFVLHSE